MRDTHTVVILCRLIVMNIRPFAASMGCLDIPPSNGFLKVPLSQKSAFIMFFYNLCHLRFLIEGGHLKASGT